MSPCRHSTLLAAGLLLAATAPSLRARDPFSQTATPGPGDPMIAEYFKKETARLEAAQKRRIASPEKWLKHRDLHRKQLQEMLGLMPMPERTPLKPVITGRIEREDFTVEKLHFQSRPGLYVTGNLYLPKNATRTGDVRFPAILYVCGHAKAREGDVSFGNKTSYHHHGVWFARHGYVCLTIDTLQLGEIEGTHHGTHRYGRWWWSSRGYTPAGVEAWNGIRALDYLQTRPEVDGDRLGVTGRSGGGAYSWWVAALDERIKAAVPVAGIASLRNHVVDGCVEGHCDCMFHVNTYRWDFANIASLVAPRALLIANTDKDAIFPLDGVVDVYNQTRQVYRMLDAEHRMGLAIVEGPHKDTQPLRVPAFHWFERFLKGKEPTDTFEGAAGKVFEPSELKVFKDLPADETNTSIDETFTVKPKGFPVPSTQKEWEALRLRWMQQLRWKSFRGWPAQGENLTLTEAFSKSKDGITLHAWEFNSQGPVKLRLFVAHQQGLAPWDFDHIVLNVLDEAEGMPEFAATLGHAFPGALKGVELPKRDGDGLRVLQQWFEKNRVAMAYVAPRGVGPTRWTEEERERTHIDRRFLLLGQTLDGMRVWDVRRAIQALRKVPGVRKTPVRLEAQGPMAGVALYASLFEPGISQLQLHALPASHREGPHLLNVLRFIDLPQAVALAAERSRVHLDSTNRAAWSYPGEVVKALNWGGDTPGRQFVVKGPIAKPKKAAGNRDAKAE